MAQNAGLSTGFLEMDYLWPRFQAGFDGPVAQWIEHRTSKQDVVGSNPTGRTTSLQRFVCEMTVCFFERTSPGLDFCER